MVKYFPNCRKQLMSIKVIFMSKSKKVCFKVILCIAILFSVTYWITEKAITANISKAAITQKLEAVTGYHVDINGDLHWHYSLRPSVDLDKITFTSEAHEIISFKNAHISLALLPLLHKKFLFDIDFQAWQQNQLHFSNGSAHIKFENNVLNITRFQSTFYQGKMSGQARVDLNHSIPKFDITLKTTQTEIADLLTDIAQTSSVSGKMDASATLISQGKTAKEFIENLDGTIALLVKNGELKTIRLDQIKVFDTLQIDAPLKNGIANTTIHLLAKNFRAEGKGTVNLIDERLNIHLNGYYTRSVETKEIALPMDIIGPIASPSVSVDISQPINQLLNTKRGRLGDRLKNFLNR